MPNYCANTLTITGPPSDLLSFFLANSDGDDESFIPLKFSKALPPPSGGDTLQWRVDHWGTKWEPFCGAVSNGVESSARLQDFWTGALEPVVVTFDTAWAPPIAWLEYVAPGYPTLEFVLEFAEAGADFQGVATAKGELFDLFEEEYHH
jgi:hypothetical protein